MCRYMIRALLASDAPSPAPVVKSDVVCQLKNKAIDHNNKVHVFATNLELSYFLELIRFNLILTLIMPGSKAINIGKRHCAQLN